jgi:hypothetical protein
MPAQERRRAGRHAARSARTPVAGQDQKEQASKVLKAASGQPTGYVKVVKVSQTRYSFPSFPASLAAPFLMAVHVLISGHVPSRPLAGTVA